MSWLSSRAPSQSVYVPYFGSSDEYPARMNANYLGEPIQFKDHHYLRGIGVHSYSQPRLPPGRQDLHDLPHPLRHRPRRDATGRPT